MNCIYNLCDNTSSLRSYCLYIVALRILLHLTELCVSASSIPCRRGLRSVPLGELVVPPTTRTQITLLLSGHLSGISCLVTYAWSFLVFLCRISKSAQNPIFRSRFSLSGPVAFIKIPTRTAVNKYSYIYSHRYWLRINY